MSIADESGVTFKEELRAGQVKMGLFINSHSTTVAEQISHLGYDWLLVDMQHGPMTTENLSCMLCAIASGGAKSMVRVAGFDDRAGIQQALDLGADGILVPYINTAQEAIHAVSCCRYPTAGTRSVYFPQRSTNKKGLLGYVGNANKNVIIALQIETADSIKNMDAIASVEGVDMLFLGQNDLCMSMVSRLVTIFSSVRTDAFFNRVSLRSTSFPRCTFPPSFRRLLIRVRLKFSKISVD